MKLLKLISFFLVLNVVFALKVYPFYNGTHIILWIENNSKLVENASVSAYIYYISGAYYNYVKFNYTIPIYFAPIYLEPDRTYILNLSVNNDTTIVKLDANYLFDSNIARTPLELLIFLTLVIASFIFLRIYGEGEDAIYLVISLFIFMLLVYSMSYSSKALDRGILTSYMLVYVIELLYVFYKRLK